MPIPGLAGSPVSGFTYTGLPARVVFGSGTFASVRAEAERLAIQRALVLTTPAQTAHGRAATDLLGDRAVGVFSGAMMHTPVAVTQAALDLARELAADGIVAIGGGSTIGLAKAIAVRTGLPQIAIPTTYAGSEMTPILGETEGRLKTTRSSPDILPEMVIYDADLTLGLPAQLSGTSGINAIAHAAEALYSRDANPVTSLLAEQSIAALARALPAIADRPADRSARRDALYGAWLSGMCLGTVGMALHHKLCHVLGGTFGLPHSETHTVILPHAIAYNAAAAPEAVARIAAALGTSENSGGAAMALYHLADAVGAERSLAALGMPADGLDRAADLAVANPYWNPRPLERAAIRDLLERAFTGTPPA
ncbi:MAG: maleylacetate reductase [Deltaproteobacteria bacterium]|nr:MAG: maleylacetate reductase [Deltaproteobacteria bacterium]TMQ12796.1 MAG: maleylacetate reductase [Deltaproteobacteria bacterium]